MQMVRMVARQAFPYWGRTIQAGEAFDASAMDANVLIVMGKATEADAIESDGLAEVEDAPRRRRRRAVGGDLPTA